MTIEQARQQMGLIPDVKHHDFGMTWGQVQALAVHQGLRLATETRGKQHVAQFIPTVYGLCGAFAQTDTLCGALALALEVLAQRPAYGRRFVIHA